MNRKGSRPVLSGGKSSDNIKGLPIAIRPRGRGENGRPRGTRDDGPVKEEKSMDDTRNEVCRKVLETPLEDLSLIHI